MSASQDCSAPHTVEWRVRGNEPKPPQGELKSRAAVCILGLARSVDWTIPSMDRNLLQKIGIEKDLFAFVSAGRDRSSCEDFHDLSNTPEFAFFPELGLSTFQILASAIQATQEWAALLTVLHHVVAGRIDWSDRPLDLLRNAKVWRRSIRRPGGWIGGVTDENGYRRPASGLSQARSLQWCADAVRWREEHVLGHQYTHLIFTRWDLQWALPFPGVSLLSSMEPEAVWVPVTHSAFYRNDRFAVVPRHAMEAYFGGWKLIISGEAEQVFEKIFPHCGLPVYYSGVVSTEAFLYARLKYANINTSALPDMAFVHCTPGLTVTSFSHNSCSPFSAIFGGIGHGGWLDEVNRLLGGSKYPTEVYGIFVADYVLNPEDHAVPAGNKLTKRVHLGCDNGWTSTKLRRAAAQCEDTEVEQTMEIAWCGQGQTGAVDQQFVHGCRLFRSRLLELGKYDHALSIARAAASISPYVLEHWLWLLMLLNNPPFSQQNAAAAALWQAYALNPDHPIVTETLPSLRLVGNAPEFLADALGGENASWHMQVNKERTRRSMLRRRILQGECAEKPASTKLGFIAWLRFGIHFCKNRWLLAAVSVLEHLENIILSDMRPEAQRIFGQANSGIRQLETCILARIETFPNEPWIVGLSLPIFREQAYSASTLVAPKWLKQQEALLLHNGVETFAASFSLDYTNSDTLRKELKS